MLNSCVSFLKPIKDECYGTIALSKDDIKICDKAGDAKLACNAWFAMGKKDVSFCKKSREYKDLCIYVIAVNTTDVELCDLISSNEIKSLCYKNLT